MQRRTTIRIPAVCRHFTEADVKFTHALFAPGENWITVCSLNLNGHTVKENPDAAVTCGVCQLGLIPYEEAGAGEKEDSEKELQPA